MESNKNMFYKMMRNKKRSTEGAKIMEDKNGNWVENGWAIKTLCKNYFETLLNSGLNDQDRVEERDKIRFGQFEEITGEEVEMTLKTMKNGKSAGPDEVTTEMLKILGLIGIYWLKMLFSCVSKK